MLKKHVKCSYCGYLTLIRARESDLPDKDDARSQLSELSRLSVAYLIEVKQTARDRLTNNDFDPLTVTCGRNVWSNSKLLGQSASDALQFINMERKCRIFLPYFPGYSPKTYFEIQRERDNRRFLIVLSLVSAAVGAGFATLANWVWSLLAK